MNGQVYTADDAQKVGLIDKVGYLQAAIDAAAELADTNSRVLLQIPGMTEEGYQPIDRFSAMTIPEDNPLTAAKIALGHQLFFDKRLSGDGRFS